MRIQASHANAVTNAATSAAAIQTKAPGSKAFLTFKHDLRAKLAKHPPSSWMDIRRLSRAMFGAEAFTQVPGERFKRVVLDRAQLRTLADHPGKVEKEIRALKEKGLIPKGVSADTLSKMVARTARAVLPSKDNEGATFTVATVNDDFTDRKTNLKHVKASVVLVQEAKNTDVRKVRPGKKYGVHQNTARDDKAGTAILWKRSVAKAGKRGYALGVDPHGAKMLKRWINWTDLTIDGQKVRMISVHRPPKRYARLWPEFDKHLAAFIKASRGPVIVGMDANQRNPQEMARKTGLKWRAPKGSIDGFLVSPGITVEKMWRLPKGTSDHHPVVARFHIKPKA